MQGTVAADAPPDHSAAFRRRRLANWFPLGITYATLYMGRYNFNVSKGQIGTTFHWDKTQVGIIATCGFWMYALSVIVNGPLADRFGGRRAILIGTAGAAVMNLVLGAFFALAGHPDHTSTGMLAGLSALYAFNMYFQSFGALSVVKVNAAWFHRRERGVLGGVFGSMISLGYYFAYGVGGWILGAFPGKLWPVYVIPAATIGVLFTIDLFLVQNRPSHAGHPDFDTGDESHDAGPAAPTEEKVPFGFVIKKVISHPVIRLLAVAEFCTGFVRQGLLLYFPEFLKEVHGIDKTDGLYHLASTGITVGGIAGALVCGFLSDYFFDSRRTPVAFIFYIGQIVSILALGFSPSPTVAALLIPFSCMWIFGVHGMLSGTASMDFGGRKAAATAAGLLDGVQYVGAGLTGIGMGYLLDRFHWKIWTLSIVPFSAAGAAIMLLLWNAKPSRSAAH